MCLMCLIFSAIIVLVIMSALGLDAGKFNVPDSVRQTKPSSNTNSSNNTTNTTAS